MIQLFHNANGNPVGGKIMYVYMRTHTHNLRPHNNIHFFLCVCVSTIISISFKPRELTST